MKIIDTQLYPGSYYFERHHFETGDIDDAKAQFQRLGFTIKSLEKVAITGYIIEVVKPWEERPK